MQFLKNHKKCQKTELLNLQQQKRERHYLVLGPEYHATKFFTENLLAIEMGKNQILMNKPGCLRL